MRWRHSRKGIIEGEIVSEDSTGKVVCIKLTNHVHGLADSWGPGDILTVKRAFLRPMPTKQVAGTLQEEEGGTKNGLDG